MKVSLAVSELMPVSMIDGKLFDKLDFIGKVVRKSSKPFGGLQVSLARLLGSGFSYVRRH